MSGPWENYQAGPWTQYQSKKPEPKPEESGVLRQAADIPLSVGRGALTGIRLIADAFGAGSGVSESIKGAEGYLASLMSAQAKNDEQEIARIMKDAEDKGALEQVKAGLQAFSVAPADLIAQGLGTAAPAIVGLLGSKFLGAGAVGARVAQAGIGAAMGAGTAKGAIYEATKEELMKAGLPEQQAEERAQVAQSYGGQNLDQILLGTGLGALASATGIESAAKNILLKAGAKEAAEKGATEAVKKAGLGRAAVTGAATEAAPEFIQAGQEQVAQNIALQREGFDVPTLRGAVGAGTLEALAGAGLGGAFGAAESGARAQAREEAARILDEEARVKAEQEQAAADAERQRIMAEQRAAQAIIDEAEGRRPAEEPVGPSITKTSRLDLMGGAPAGGALGQMLTARREAEAAQAQVPLGEDYAFLVRERERLMGKEQTKETKAEIKRINDQIQQILVRDLEWRPGGPEAVRASVFGERELPKMITREELEKPAVEPFAPATTTPRAGLLGAAPAGGEIGQMLTARREAEAAQVQAPLSEDYAFLQREKQRLSALPKTPETQATIARIDTAMSEILARDVERQRRDAEAAKTSVFGQETLPPVESRDLVKGREELADLQAKEGAPEMTTLERRSAEVAAKMAGKPAPDQTENEKKVAALERERNKIKSPSLYGQLMGKLNPSEVRDISPDIGQNLRKKGGGGTFVSELVDSGELNDYLPPNMQPGSLEYDNQEATEYIKDKLRNKQTDTFAAETERRKIDGEIDRLRKSVEAPRLAEFDITEATEAEREQRAEALTAPATPEVEALLAQADQEGLDVAPIQEAAFEDSREQGVDYDTALAARLSDALGVERRFQREAEPETEVKQAAEGAPRGYMIDAEEQRIEKELTGKSMMQVADWTVTNAPNAFARVIAEKVRNRLRDFQRKGMELDFKVEGGSKRSGFMRNSRGVTEFKWGADDKASKISVTLNGAAALDNQSGFPPGMNYSTILHELLHVATRAQFRFMPSADPLKKELTNLFNKIVERYNADAKAGTLPPVMEKYYRRMNNVLTDPDEMLAWGMTDKDVQKYFDDIKVGEKSVWTQLVDLIRKALGLGKPYESALERLVRTTDSLLDVDVDVINDMMAEQGKQVGKKAGPMVQETLFQKEAQEEPAAEEKAPRRNILGNPVMGSWTMPTDTKLAGTEFGKDDLIYSLQDKQIDIKRVVQNITETAGRIASKWNPYLQEELYHGRTARATKDFLQDELRPLIQEIQRNGMTIEELETYLHNRHAEDYNNHVAKVNPNNPEMQDGGSGIPTEKAREYLASIPPEKRKVYESLAKKVDAITKKTRKVVVESGLEGPDTIAAWEQAFPNYVPLQREESDDFDYTTPAFGVGSGYDVRGKFSRAAMGSKRKVANILANIAMQREKAIIKSNKNRVAQAVFGLAVQNPNPEFWMAVNPAAEEVPQIALDELRAMGIDQEAINFLMQEPKQRAVDPRKNEVVSRINATLRNNDNVLAMRFNGENRYVFFNQNNERAKRAAEALKNLDADRLSNLMGTISKITRWMASVNTQYNPIFGAYNFLRDVQGAALQLSDTPIRGKQKEVVAGTLPALKAIYSAVRGERQGKKADTELGKLWEEFQSEGGQTGFRDMFSRSQERAEALEKELKQITEGKAKAAGRAIIDWLSDYNDSMENAVRLSAYKVAKEQFMQKGMSESEAKQEAASVAKNLTVNFNRKGQIAVQAGALYAFFNAAVQGTTRLAQTLRGPAGKKIIGGGLLLGAMQAALLAAAGFDEEEPPEFVRERNLIIPLGGDKYFAFPMPLGYHVIPGVSRIVTEWALSGFKNTPERITSLTGMFLEAFNPIGNAGWSVQTIAPTFADPLVALSENKDWTGKPIARKDFNSMDPTPGYTRAKDTASEFSTQIAKFLNFASGGTKYQPGVISPTPDQIDYLIGQAFGGIGREAVKLEQTVAKTISGEELPTYKVPLVGRFYGETKGSAAESNRFYKNLTLLNQHENELKGRRANREPVTEYLKENPEARLAPMAQKVYRDIRELRKRKAALLEKDAPRESIQQVEKQITRKMQMFNERVAALKD